MKSARHVLAGRRSALLRSEARDRFLGEVERVDPGLLDMARRLERSIPLRPEGMTRVEWFFGYVEENPEEQWEHAQAAADRDVDAWIREYMQGAA